MSHYSKLMGDKCYLSPVAVEDADRWAAWLNDPEVSLPLGDELYELLTREAHLAHIEQIQRDQHKVFSIVDCASQQAIGRCVLVNIVPVDRRAMMGIFIGEKQFWGQGYGTEATSLLLDYAFNALNLNSVQLGVFVFNQRAIACYKKVGFKEIGIRRQFRIIAGQKYDMLFMDILAEEFKSPYLVALAQRLTLNT